MECLLLLYGGEKRWASLPDEERASILGEYFALTDEMGDAGVFVSGGPLQPTSRGSRVRVRDNELHVTDGHFVESKEELAGYFLLEVESLDEARAWAGKVPAARWGSVEVRPLIQLETRALAA
jgi:hypothetical protein